MLTIEQLGTLYLKDLEQPDIHHGRTSPKARHIQHWHAIKSFYKGAHPGFVDTGLDLDKLEPGQDVWCWSDIHFGHKNIIKYAEGYRPFSSVEEMNAAMISRYQAVVKPDDIVIWGGDIGFISENAINEILRSLPGYKIHIVGNHDIHRDGSLYKLDMDERHLCYVVRKGKLQILVTHYPLDKVPDGCVNMHGHIHQNLANAWNMNMCVEHTGCAPKNIKEFIIQAEQYLKESGQ